MTPRGSPGGQARAAKLSPARRHEIATTAARVRWGAEPKPISEAELMREIMLEASRRGHRLWRNTVGNWPDATGAWVRTGLAVKSADLIGLRRGDGRFLSVEVKRPGWRPPTKAGQALDHYEGQAAWMRMVRALGGIAGFATSVEEAMITIETGLRRTCSCGYVGERGPVDCPQHGPWGWTDSTGAVRWFVRGGR